MKKTRKVLAIMLSIIMLITFETTAAAEESESLNIFAVDITNIDVSTDSIEGTIEVGNAVPSADGLVEFESIDAEESARNGNTPPVAALQYVILNPESLLNGNFTTNTQIAWLWSYNGVNFTYDPDGDAITNISIGGIPSNAIIGYITGDIGFATQFDTAGQYQMTYQVRDARGALSNIVKVVFNIEPADGNTRPICQINHNLSGEYLRANEPLVISWQNSSDSDSGDYVADARGLVYKDGSTTSTDLSKYVVGSAAGGVSVKFNAVGIYEIWMSVCDSTNAWSNWVVFTIEVRSGSKQFSNITTDFMTDPDPGQGNYWVDNFGARELSMSYEPAQILEITGSSSYISSMRPSRVATGHTISGTLKYSDNTPCANTQVTITMPMTYGRGLNTTISTDSSGNFSYYMGLIEYWTNMGYDHSTVTDLFSGDCTGEYTPYCHYSILGTNFYYNTTITLSASDASWSQDVTALAGVARKRIIGRWVYVGTSNGVEIWDMLL